MSGALASADFVGNELAVRSTPPAIAEEDCKNERLETTQVMGVIISSGSPVARSQDQSDVVDPEKLPLAG